MGGESRPVARLGNAGHRLADCSSLGATVSENKEAGLAAGFSVTRTTDYFFLAAFFLAPPFFFAAFFAAFFFMAMVRSPVLE
jgi:hypothetical protein